LAQSGHFSIEFQCLLFGRVATLGGARTLLTVPMLRVKVLVGAIAIYRQEVRPFNDNQISPAHR
jgi:hypothetical protein